MPASGHVPYCYRDSGATPRHAVARNGQCEKPDCPEPVEG
jgi:hypothetical protein